MKQFLLTCMALVFLISTMSYAQDRTITGTVTAAEDNQPMPSVTVMIKGTNTATQTDIDGKYSIKAPAGSTLVFSFVGYSTREVKLGSSSTINITLPQDSRQLGEVVVTALGIEKKSKGLTYSTQKISGDQLTIAKDPNLMNSLSGKAAGVQINRSSSGAGGSVKVNLRGSRSVNGNNDPLYVIDGIPMANFSPSQPTTTFGDNNSGNRDGGDGIGNLNPDDIESINVLKGASAASLYGSQAANGVIVITTKKGKSGTQRVDFSSGFTTESAISLPSLQTTYGQTAAGATTSWGTTTSNATVSPNDFFRNGTSFINSISLSAGNEKAQTYFSYANTTSNGIVPTNSFNKHNFNFRETARLFENKLTLDGNINLVSQKVNNRATSGFYNNAYMAVYMYPRGLDMSQYEKTFETYDEVRQLNTQNWFVYDDNATFSQNPYWLLNRTPSSDKLNRTMGSLSARWDFSNMFNVQIRGNVDRSSTTFEQQMYAGTSTIVVGGYHNPLDGPLTSGRYVLSNANNTQLYGDVLLNFKKDFSKNVGLTASVGSSITDTKVEVENFDTYLQGMAIPNVFTIQNMNSGSIMNQGVASGQPSSHRQLQAVYGTAQLAIKDAVFVDLTARNDWSSTLAFTESANKGYFYPSAGVTFMLNQLVKMPAAIDYGKLRVSYAKVGNDFPWNVTSPSKVFQTNSQVVSPISVPAPGVDLKPELSSSFEIGTEWKFWNERLTFDLTAYKTNTTNQLLQIPAPAANPEGATNYWINAGNIENKGFEAVLGVTPVKTNDFSYTASVNFSLNRNKVISLSEELDANGVSLTTSGNNNYVYKVSVGRPYGDIWGQDFARDANGAIIFDQKTNLPTKAESFTLLGNPSPNFLAGFNNSFKYKNLSFNFLIDGRFGGQVMSMSQATMDLAGVTSETARDRQNGYVTVEGTKISTVKVLDADGVTVKETLTGADAVAAYYASVGGRAGVTSQYMYDATNVRLRELSLGYTIPSTVFNSKVVKSITLSLVGRNLFYITKKAPFDPEMSMSTGNGLQGVDVFGLPATRSFGINARVSF